MDILNKYFIELNIECVLEADPDKKEITIDKINKAISQILKNENAVHLNVSVNLISENSLLASMTNFSSHDN